MSWAESTETTTGGIRTWFDSDGILYRTEWHDGQGHIHRDGDLPAIVDLQMGIRQWFRHGHPLRDGNLPTQTKILGEATQYWREHDQKRWRWSRLRAAFVGTVAASSVCRHSGN
jgi:hypothetical protein